MKRRSRHCALLLAASVLGAAGGLSSSPPARRTAAPEVVPLRTTDPRGGRDGPTILSLPSILPPGRASDLLAAIDAAIEGGDAAPTSSYQEDVFSKDKRRGEDALLRDIVGPLAEDGRMPTEYINDLDAGDADAALRAFVYAVTHHQDSLSEENVIAGANVIQRRQAVERWKGEDGVAIMKLSADDDVFTDEGDVDWDSISLGTRHELPRSVRRELEDIVPTLLRGSWATRDATVVKYSEGDTQVPHVDPCDATLLICLRSCEGGGATCFPALDDPLRCAHRRGGSGMLFFSSTRDGGRDARSLHHGGRVTRGEKAVVQLMLDWDGGARPASWLDAVVGFSPDRA